MQTKLNQELFLDIKKSNTTQDNHLPVENEATRDLQSIQEALMFMLIKTSCSTDNTIPNTRPQVTKKMHQQTFHQGHK
jgi:hypothetical protein